MTLPNLITIARLLLVPLVVAAIGAGYWRAAFLLFVIAGVSDAVDGFIARGHVVFGCARSAEAIAGLRRRYPAPHGFATVDVVRDDEVRAVAGDRT